ncbi:MAG: TatD family deoxyribonuclease [Bacteroidetes bacterium]|nr:MAG: TatD family deoxyribonuclease [Bacteroidota bacterium]
MIGLHPCEVKEGFENELDTLRQWLTDPACTWYGIGETGLDLYWDKSTLPLQIEALQVQIQWAKETQLPIILHARNAIDETTVQIEQAADSDLRGIFHCFDGTIAQAERILALGSFKLGIGGIVTYRKDVQEVVRQLPKSSVVLETDSPYLPPEPFRKSKNRRNESSYPRYVGESVAQLWGISYEAVAELTNQNAKEVFTSKKN